jgi:hypothetical protein
LWKNQILQFSVLDTLSVHSSRIRRLGIFFTDWVPTSLVLGQILIGWSLESLESLEFHVDLKDEDDEQFPSEYGSALRLKQLQHSRSSYSSPFYIVNRQIDIFRILLGTSLQTLLAYQS